MNGIDGLLRQHSAALDAGARTGGADGTHANSNVAADFGGHLAGLSQQESKASGPSGPARLLNRSMPALVQRSLLLETGAEDAAGHGGGSAAPDAGAKIASPPERGMTPARDSVAGGASPGVRTLAARRAALGGDAPLGDAEIPPNGRRPVLDTARDSLPGSRSASGGATAFLTSPLGQGPASLCVLLAAAQAEATGRQAPATAAFAGAAPDGMASMAAPSRSAHASGAVARTPPDSTQALRSNSAGPLGLMEMGALPGGLLSGSPAAAASLPVSAPVPAPAAAYGLAPSVGPVPQAGDGGLDRAASQDRAEPHASLAADRNWDPGPDIAAAARLNVAVVNRQTHFAPANGLSPAQQIAGLVAASARPGNADAGETAAQPGAPFDTARAAVPHLSASSVQTLQLQLDPEDLGRVTVTMRLAGTRLDLRVEAERPETMQLIDKDKVLLAGKLQSAGYAIDALVILKADPQAPHPRFGANVPPNGQEQATGQANGGPTAHDRPSTHGDRHPSRPAPADNAQDGAAIRPAGSGIYI